MFTNILTTGIPIHKKGSEKLTKNYKSISLLPICGKVFEKIVFKHLYNYLVSNNLITDNQSDCKPANPPN